MITAVTIETRKASVTAVGRVVEINAELSEDQMIDAFVTYVENSRINDAEVAALVARIQERLAV